jgi:hypothetical protein
VVTAGDVVRRELSWRQQVRAVGTCSWFVRALVEETVDKNGKGNGGGGTARRRQRHNDTTTQRQNKATRKQGSNEDGGGTRGSSNRKRANRRRRDGEERNGSRGSKGSVRRQFARVVGRDVGVETASARWVRAGDGEAPGTQASKQTNSVGEAQDERNKGEDTRRATRSANGQEVEDTVTAATTGRREAGTSRRRDGGSQKAKERTGGRVNGQERT